MNGPAGTAETHEEGAGIPESVWLHGNPWQPTAMWGVTWVIMMLLALVGLSRLKKVPGTLQGAWEFTYEWFETIALQVVGKDGMVYFPLFLSIFLYVLFNNLLGLFPFMASATSKTDTTLALAAITACSTHILGIKKKGFFGYIGHFFQVLDFRTGDSLLSKSIMFVLQFVLLPVIEIIGVVAQPISLAARLFGNIFAKEMILAVLAAMTVSMLQSTDVMEKCLVLLPLALRPGIIILGVLVSLIQAVVFTVLSMVYIGNAITVHHPHDEEGLAKDATAPVAAH
jgi:F-type H+-transporting ATPase subunit a